SEDSSVCFFRPTEADLLETFCSSALALSLYFIDVLLFSFQGSLLWNQVAFLTLFVVVVSVTTFIS
ncbi:hypothetical protein, partial [Sporosarcina sp. ANT_H38]|uniref:hypothetical protein n=1 Tax=Sporosarcina sp. ANT_H38 TaxID=2597358 RepID=UPI001CAA82B0